MLAPLFMTINSIHRRCWCFVCMAGRSSNQGHILSRTSFASKRQQCHVIAPTNRDDLLVLEGCGWSSRAITSQRMDCFPQFRCELDSMAGVQRLEIIMNAPRCEVTQSQDSVSCMRWSRTEARWAGALCSRRITSKRSCRTSCTTV